MDKKVTTFIFDCFKVLLTPPLSGWYEENIINRGIIDDNFPEIVRKYDIGDISEDDFLDYLMTYNIPSKTKENIRKEVDDLCFLDYELVGTIKKLKQKGYKIGLLSNANHAFFDRKAFPSFPEFKGLFDEIVISSIVRLLKPDPEIYKYTLSKINSLPEEVIFIDDNIVNIRAAEALGIKGFLYTDSVGFVAYLQKNNIIS